MSHELRRSYLVKRSFQLKLVLRLSLMILVTSSMVSLIFIGSRYYVIAIVQGNPLQFHMLDELGGIFFEVLIYWLVGYLVLFAYFALRFSNEIAGPLYRFEKALLAIADDGKLTSEIRLRDDDDAEYHRLAALYNRALARVRSAVTQATVSAERLRALEKSAGPTELREGLGEARAELESALGKLGSVLPDDDRQQRLPGQDPADEQPSR